MLLCHIFLFALAVECSLAILSLFDTTPCPQEKFHCQIPMAYEKTQGYRCNYFSCPKGFACCPDTCFQHKICKADKNPDHTNVFGIISRVPSYRPFRRIVEVCPTEIQVCPVPHDLKKTKHLACDGQCPRWYKCCSDSCFRHKVCKKATLTVVEDVPPTISQKTNKSKARDEERKATTEIKNQKVYVQPSTTPINRLEATSASPVSVRKNIKPSSR